MLKRREKLIVAAVPTGIVLIVVWVLWLSPRLAFHGIAAGDWPDFSGVKHTRVGDETVISFRARGDEALEDMIDRLGFHRGVPAGNADEISESAIRTAGFDPNRFDKYFFSRKRILFLYVNSHECVMVRTTI
ncbi:MAG: hypothetical protein J0M04_20550 [Verrucomicrobia bacterium]|nr:hypothetical protein [Verrucomicrobiota bacterium]